MSSAVLPPAAHGLSFPARTPAASPTRARFGVLTFLSTLSFILYIDRGCIGKAAPAMEADLGLSHTLMGYVFAAFAVAYALFEAPTGRLGDRFGSRGVLTRIVLWWSLFTALTGSVWAFTFDSGFTLNLFGLRVPLLVNGFLVLLAVRFLFGVGEAGAYPNSVRVIARWFPPDRRGPALGLLSTMALAGGAAAPVAAAYLIELVGWRLAFVGFGSLGVVWAAAFWRWFRDDPAGHPAVNDAELRLIRAGAAGAAGVTHAPVPWRKVLGSANLWLLGGINVCNAAVSCAFLFWYPTYLELARGLDPVATGWLSGAVLAGGAVGALLGGHLSDALRRRSAGGGLRCWLGFGGYALAAAMLALGLRCDSALASALCITLGYVGVNVAFINWWAMVTELSGEHVGSLFGLANGMALPGAFAGTMLFGAVVDWRKAEGDLGRAAWDPSFLGCVACLATAAVLWRLVKPGRPFVGR
jgi:MFS family permease